MLNLPILLGQTHSSIKMITCVENISNKLLSEVLGSKLTILIWALIWAMRRVYSSICLHSDNHKLYKQNDCNTSKE